MTVAETDSPASSAATGCSTTSRETIIVDPAQMSCCHSEGGTGGLFVRGDTQDPNWECTRNQRHGWRASGEGDATSSVSAPEGSSIAIGIDTAVPANHHVVVRRPHAGRKGEVDRKSV